MGMNSQNSIYKWEFVNHKYFFLKIYLIAFLKYFPAKDSATPATISGVLNPSRRPPAEPHSGRRSM